MLWIKILSFPQIEMTYFFGV